MAQSPDEDRARSAIVTPTKIERDATRDLTEVDGAKGHPIQSGCLRVSERGRRCVSKVLCRNDDAK